MDGPMTAKQADDDDDDDDDVMMMMMIISINVWRLRFHSEI